MKLGKLYREKLTSFNCKHKNVPRRVMIIYCCLLALLSFTISSFFYTFLPQNWYFKFISMFFSLIIYYILIMGIGPEALNKLLITNKNINNQLSKQVVVR